MEKLKFRPTQHKDFLDLKSAQSYQRMVAKKEEVLKAMVKELYNIHTKDWVYRVEIEMVGAK